METNIRYLIDFEKVDTLLEGFNKSTGFVTAILDFDGNVLSKSGWRQMCTEFHRVNPETSKKCIISDTQLANKMNEGAKYHYYKCLNGLVDVVVPIVINGEHIANLFSGQFFFEEPDNTFFKMQAEKYGFDEGKYLAALKNVPVFSHEKVKTVMDFLLNMTQIISDLTFQKANQFELNKQIIEAKEKAEESEEKYRLLHENAGIGIGYYKVDGTIISFNNIAARNMNGLPEDFIGKSLYDFFPKSIAEFYHERIKKAVESEIPFSYEDEVNLPTGNKYFLSIYTRIINVNGEIEGIQILSHDISDRRQTEAALRENEENLSITLHSIGDGVISTDINGLVVQMNPVAEKLCGWTLAEARAKPLSEVFKIITAESRQTLADPVKIVLEKGEIVGLANHTVLVSRNGTEYQISDSAAPIKNKKGEIIGVVLVFSDVTESYVAQKHIKESEERFRSLLNNLEAGIVVHAADTSIAMNNQKACELLGLTDDQMRGKAAIDPAWKFIHEDNTPLRLDEYPVIRIVTGKKPIKNQLLGICQPGKNNVVWVTVNGFPVMDTNDEISEVVISFIDISDRIQAGEKIKLSEEKFSKSFFNSPDSIIINRLDDGKIVTVNNGFKKIMGYEEAEVIGKTTTELNFYKNPEERNAIINALKTKGQAQDIECWFITKYGEEKLGLLSAAIIVVDGVKHIISTSRDITHRKKSELLLQEKTEEIEAQNEEYQQLNEELNQTNQELAITLLRAEESEAIIKAALENSQAGIAIAECPSGKLKYVNKAALLIRGKEYDEIVKDIDLDKYASSWKILHFDGTPYKPDEVPLARAILYGETNSREFIVRRDTHEDRYVWANAAPIFNAQGIQTSAIVVFLDITERKLTEQALKKSEEKYQSIIQSQSEGICVINQNEVFEFANLAAEKIFETGPGELIGASLYDFLHPEETGKINFQTGERQQGNSGTYEIHIITKKGNAKFIHVSSSPKLDENKNYLGAYGVFRDITERRLLNDVHSFLSTSGYSGSGQNFFESLAKYLSEILDSEYVCIDKLEGDGLTAQTVAIYNEGKFDPNVSYTLKQTPCGDVVGKNICCFPENVCQLFPQDEALQELKAHSYIGTTLWSFDGKPIGLIAIIGQKPMKNAAFAENVLKLVAIRAAGELERRLAEEKLSRNERELKRAQQITHIGSWYLDLLTNEVVWSEELYKMYGFDPALPPPSYTEHMKLFTSESWDLLSVSLENTRQTGIPYELELRTVRSDGSNGWMWVRGEAIQDKEAKTIGLWGAAQDISKEKLIQEELIKAKLKTEESEAFFRSIFENSPVGKSITGIDGTLKTNKSFSDMLGYSFDEFQAKNFINITHPDDIQKSKEVIEALLTGKESVIRFEKKYIHKNGSVVYSEVLTTLQKNKDGKPLFFITSVQNITERKLSEKALKESEERFKNMFERHSSIMLLVDPESGLIINANDASARFYGYSKTELLSMRIDQINILPPEQVKKERERAVREERTYFIFPHKLANGEVRTVEVHSSPIVFEDHQILFSIIHDITERKKAEEVSKKEQALSNAIIESIPGTFYLLDETGQYVRWNAYQRDEIVGKPDELVGRTNALDTIHPNDRELIQSKIANVLANGVVEIVESRVLLRGGPASRWLVMTGSRMLIDGHPFLVGIGIDITERKLAEEKLKESELKYRSLIENTSDAIFCVDEKGEYKFTNNLFASTFGKSPEYFAGKTFWDIYDKQHADNRYETVKRVFLTGKSETIEVEVPLPDKTLYFLASSNPIKDDTGRVILNLTHATDITKIKMAEHELLIAKEIADVNTANITAIIEGTADSIWAFNEQFEIVYINQAFKREFHQSFGIWLEPGSSLVNSLPETIRPFWKQRYVRVLNNEQFTVEDAVDTGNGTLYIQVSFNPIIKKGQVIGGSCFGSDITSRKLAEIELIKAKAQAEESDRLKSAFLANMSHEIRTPMNGILGFAEILKDPELSGDQQKEYIKIIERSGKRMLNIINDIVDISKIEAGLMKLKITESDINEQIEYIYTFFKPEVEAKGMKFSFKTTMTAREATILTDREKVYAILTNLVKNAIKYSNEGSIELGYSVKEMSQLAGGKHEPDLIEFYVRDTGIGIPHNRQEAIFERFIQADITDKLALQGAGLGLAITKSYVEMLGGKIWVESQEGEGSTFYFTLPYNHISESNSSAQSSVSVNEKYNWSKKLKILIAEDDQASEMLISLMVNTFGREILKVETGIDAIEACRNNPDIDLILMDIQMPVMGGYEATRQIRKFNKNVLIIAQTAYGLSGDREKAIEAGCNEYLSKPINKAELLAKIHKHFNN